MMTNTLPTIDLLDPYATPLAVVVDEPVLYVDATLATASWWDEWEIQPGEYPVGWTNLGGSPYRVGAITPGYIRPTHAYYAKVEYDAVLVRKYREARLLHEVHAQQTVPDDRKVVTLTRDCYGYEVAKGGYPLQCVLQDVARLEAR